MSIISIPNQPILFNIEQPCDNFGINNNKQLVNFQDQLFFQIEFDCGSEQISNQDFTDNVWTYNGVTYSNDGTPGGFFKPRIRPNDIFTTFEVTVIITELNSGQLTVQMQGGQTYNLTTAGTHTLYFNTDVMLLTSLTPTITYSGDTFNGSFVVGSFRQAFVRGLFSNHKFFIVDSDDNVVIEDADYYQIVDNTLTVGFNLDNHDALSGCYRIGYADECDNSCSQFRINNGLFAEDTGWTLINGASISTSPPELNLLVGGVGLPRATSQTLFCENKTYNVEISVTKITGGQIAVRIGNSAILLINSIGTYSQNLTSTSGTELYIELSGVATNEADIDYIEVKFADTEPYVIDGYSNVLSIGEYSSCKYVKLEGCNGNDSFNFKFEGSGFIPGIRLEKRFFRPQYNSDVEVYRDSEGNFKTNYADIEKIKTLRLEQQPEYVFDFLSVLVYFDNFYVDGVTYVLNETDFPSIEWDDANENGNINLELKRKQGLLRKVNCQDIDADCLPTVFGGDENDFLLQNEDRFVLQNGDDFDLQE